ncbi:hypothetical protein [Halosegnis longus]|uniref:hypothetical protein n=1 Tax=Halosegnis longus TaxID=2216012 RepID=UPI00129E9DB8|nr:hypothetical protein [Halosegnis longus]
MSERAGDEQGDYRFTAIDYPHPFMAPDTDRLTICCWFDFGCRAFSLEVAD